MKKVLLGLFGIVLLVSCTGNQRARTFGGTETIQLEEGVRLVNVTWKGREGGGDLWILTKKDTTKATTYSFKEKSNFGVMEGEVIIIEK
jgi:hypothetical protein